MEVKQYFIKKINVSLKKEEIKKYLEDKWKQKHVDTNLFDAVKAVLREKFMAIQSYLKKQTNKNLKQHNFTPKTTMERTKTPF